MSKLLFAASSFLCQCIPNLQPQLHPTSPSIDGDLDISQQDSFFPYPMAPTDVFLLNIPEE